VKTVALPSAICIALLAGVLAASPIASAGDDDSAAPIPPPAISDSPAPIPLLLQFANYEQYFDKTSIEHYAAAASDPKKVLYYDTGHDLNDPQALDDRYNWLVKHIDLRREPVLTH